MRAFRSELIRIQRPAFLFGGIGLMALFAGIVSVFIFTSAESTPAAPRQAGQGPGAYTVAEIASPGGFLTALPTVSTLAGVILLALWAIAVATDYSTGLIRILTQALTGPSTSVASNDGTAIERWGVQGHLSIMQQLGASTASPREAVSKRASARR